MAECELDGCDNDATFRFCSTACSNRARGRRRKCLDGVSLCTSPKCDCQGRKVRLCIVCGEPRGRYSVKYCNNARCKARGQHGTEENLRSWLDGSDNASIMFKSGDKAALAGWAREYLLDEAGDKCTRCGWNEPHPLTGRPPLEIDHIDGNRLNNLRSNLRVLCPNCHALTLTYRRWNYKNVQQLRETDWKIDPV